MAGTAAGAGAATAPAGDKVTFTIGIPNDVDSFNPFTGIVAEAYEAWGLMYDSLVGYSDKDFSPVPALAESWTTSEDGLTWTYTIRDGVTWSDGVPLTAKDVAYTFNRVLDGQYEQTNYGNYTENITSVTAPDDRTVVMVTTTPSPIMLRLAVPILPEHIWKDVDENAVSSYANDTDVVGSGPFVLTEHVAGQFARFTANPNYWGGAPAIDEVVFRVYSNADAVAQALRKGELDFADTMEADVWDSLAGAENVTQYAATYSGFDEVAFNTGAALDDGTPIGDGHPALKDKRVRVALNHAIDRQALVDRILNGNGTAGSTIIPPIYADLHLQPATPYPFDLDEANRLLDEAGYARGDDGIRTMPDGTKPLVFRFATRAESPTSQQTGQFVQGWFADLGITINLSTVSEDTLTEQVGQGTFDLFEWGWVVEPDPNYQLSTFTCASRSYKDGADVYANLSDSFFCNAEYDRLYAEQATQVDPARRAETVKAMQQILYDEAPYAVTFYYDNLQAYSNRFTGFVPQPPPDGALLFQYGTYTYRALTLASTGPTGSATAAPGGASDDGDSGSQTAVWIAVGVALFVAIGGGAFARSRRRGTDEDSE